MEKEKKNKTEEKEEEPEIITWKEIVERHKDIKIDELKKLVLVCKNCGHKDLLGNFLKKRERELDVRQYRPDDWEPRPHNPDDWKLNPPPFKPHRPFTPRYKCANQNKKVMMIMVDNEEYEDMFFCKKCGSSLVVLCKEFTKNNIARTL